MGISKTEILGLFKNAGMNVSSDAKTELERALMKALTSKVNALAAAKKRAGKKTVYAEDIAVMLS